MNLTLVKITLIVILIFNFFLFYIVPNTMDIETMSLVIIISLFCLFIFFLKKETHTNLKGQYLKHSNLIIVGLVIVYFQYPIDYILGNVTGENLDIWHDRSIVLKSLVLSSIGFISFMLGYLLYAKRTRIIYQRIIKNEKEQNVVFLEILAIISLLIYFLTVNPLYLIGYYGEEQMGNEATRAILLFKVFVFVIIIQKFRNQVIKEVDFISFKNYIKYLGWPLILSILLYLISVILSGDRGPIIVYGLLLLSGYIFINNRKIKLKAIILFLITGSIFITILGIARNQDRSLSFKEKINIAITQNDDLNIRSISPQTQELAGSIITLHAAVSYMENNEFLYGRFQFQQFVSAIPFSYTFFNDLFTDNSLKYLNSASFITWIIQGEYPTYGNGSSSVADFYLDFGLIGVLLGMLLFGYLMRFAEISFFSNELPRPFLHIFSVVYLCSAIYVSRLVLVR